MSGVRAAGLGLAVSFPFAFVPLLDGLTYEYAVAIGLLAFAVAVAAGVRAGRLLEPPYRLRWKLLERTPRERVEPEVRRAWAWLSVAVAAAAVVPAAHGAWAGCAFERGVFIYLFVALPAVPLGIATGLAATVFGHRSAARRWAIGTGLVLAFAVLTVREVLFGPRAVFHNLVTGILAATSYLGFDDTVRVVPADVVHRAAALVVAAILLAAATAHAARRGVAAAEADKARVRLLLDEERRSARRRLAAGLSLLALLVAAGDRSGFGTGEATLARALAGRHESPHFTLRFRPAGRAEALAPVLAADCEWARVRLRDQLGLGLDGGGEAPRDRIEVFIYEDDAAQLDLTGASGYLFAKPWRGEIHTLLDAAGDLVALRHELAHVIAAGFGLPGLRVSSRYGLIEGLAEALGEDYAGRPWRHQPVAAALARERLPRAAAVIGNLGFAAGDARVSYLAAASFCGWLLDAYGPRRLREVYAWGDFEHVYGRSLAELDRGWRRFLGGIAVDARSLEQSERAFDRTKNPPFFRRHCARLGFRATAATAASAGCDGDGPCGRESEASAAERRIARLDREAATGASLERDAALAALTVAFVRARRLDDAAIAIHRRLDLGVAPPRVVAVLTEVAAEPQLIPPALAALGEIDQGDVGELEGSGDGVGRVLALALDLQKRSSGTATIERARLVGGCASGLESIEARLLVRAARSARRLGAINSARSFAETALSIASPLSDESADARLEILRLDGRGTVEGIKSF